MNLIHILSVLACSVSLGLASNVLEANSKNFASLLGSTPSLVELYAAESFLQTIATLPGGISAVRAGSGHCKNLAPIYEQLADAFAGKSRDKVKIVKVDADGEGREIGGKYGVTGFPTLKWFPQGSDSDPVDYTGARDLDALAAYVTEKSGAKSSIKPPPPPTTVQLDSDAFESVALAEDKDVLVAFTAPWCGHCKNLKPTLDKVSSVFKLEQSCIIANFDADAAQNKPIAQRYGVSSYPTIKFFPKGPGKTPEAYNLARREEDFVEYLNEKCGTFRAVGGGLNDQAGLVKTLDEVVTNFIKGPSTKQSEILEAAQKIQSEIGSAADYYLKVMEKIINGTINYVEKEEKRLASLIAKGNLNPEKIDQIKTKANILKVFSNEPGPRERADL